MKKLSLLPYIFLIALFATPFSVFAQAPSLQNIELLVESALRILNVVTILFFVLAIVVFAWGIILFINAAGDPGALRKAKGYIIWGIIGIAVLASIFGLIQLLQTSFSIGGQGTLEIPDIEQEGPTGTPLGP
ncbi:MAG: hypothetical protein AAB539_03930 [Patescibacteria group bacterium]